MGVFVSTIKPNFEVFVKTGDVKGAGTNSNVYITFIDQDGNRSKDTLLDCTWRDDFEKGNLDLFKLGKVPEFGTLNSIEVRRDSSGLKDDWFVEFIKVRQYRLTEEKERTYEEFPFPINRWIQAKRRYVFKLYDSVLPQFDENPEQRNKELDEKREKYKFIEGTSDVPRRVCKYLYDVNVVITLAFTLTTASGIYIEN